MSRIRPKEQRERRIFGAERGGSQKYLGLLEATRVHFPSYRVNYFWQAPGCRDSLGGLIV